MRFLSSHKTAEQLVTAAITLASGFWLRALDSKVALLLRLQRLRPMLAPKSFATAAMVIGGIEAAEKIKKGPFKTGKLGGRSATMPEIWLAALAA